MKFKLYLLLIILFIPEIRAIQTNVYVEFPNVLEGYCYNISPGLTAKQVLKFTNYSTRFKFSGGFLNSIENYSCNKDECWFFYYDEGDGMIFSDYGINQYKIEKNRTILYFGYYKYGKDFKPVNSPKDVSFNDTCIQGKEINSGINKNISWLLVFSIPLILYLMLRKK